MDDRHIRGMADAVSRAVPLEYEGQYDRVLTALRAYWAGLKEDDMKAMLYMNDARAVRVVKAEDGRLEIEIDFELPDAADRIMVGRVKTEWTDKPLFLASYGELSTWHDDSP
jgi:SpoVK/Ycf46/Vps4 family AAA+-type ATPase